MNVSTTKVRVVSVNNDFVMSDQLAWKTGVWSHLGFNVAIGLIMREEININETAIIPFSLCCIFQDRSFGLVV